MAPANTLATGCAIAKNPEYDPIFPPPSSPPLEPD